MVTVGARIRFHREQCRYSLTDLAERSGVARSYLWGLERDDSSPSVALLAKIAQALGVPSAALLPDAGTPPTADPVVAFESWAQAHADRFGASIHDPDIAPVVGLFARAWKAGWDARGTAS